MQRAGRTACGPWRRPCARAVRGWLLLAAPLAGWLLLATAACADVIEMVPGAESVRISTALDYLVDADGDLSLEQAMARHEAGAFRRYTGRGEPTFGFSGGAVYWFAFRLAVADPGDDYILAVDHPPLQRVSLYTPVAEVDGTLSVHTSGAVIHPNLQPLPTRKPVFNLPVAAHGEQTYYLRVETPGSVELPMRVWRADAWVDHSAKAHWLFGIYYGVVLAMLLYNLLIYFYVRDVNYLFYVAAVGFTAFFLFGLNGFGSLYLWPGSAAGADLLLPAFLMLGLLASIRFARSFLRVDAHWIAGDRLLLLLEAVLIVLLVANLFTPYALMIRIGSGVTLVTAFAVFAAAAICWQRGVGQARFFIVAWAALIVGGALHALKAFGFVPLTFTTQYAFQIGSGMETILLSIALADRLRLLRAENERIQREATDLLERRVEDRTRALNEALDQLRASNERLRETSRRDGLTGVHNRYYFDITFEREWAHAARGTYPLSLLLIDIDEFKRINDTLGHPLGDRVLREVAAILADEAERSVDLTARYGGEEFVMLLPYTRIEAAASLAERLRRRVEGAGISAPTGVLHITVSIGVATARPQPGDNREELLQRADDALYRAKAAGRNCVEVAE